MTLASSYVLATCIGEAVLSLGEMVDSVAPTSTKLPANLPHPEGDGARGDLLSFGHGRQKDGSLFVVVFLGQGASFMGIVCYQGLITRLVGIPDLSSRVPMRNGDEGLGF